MVKDNWSPDKEFIEFLECMEKQNGEVTALNGKRVIDLIKQGTKTGKKKYKKLYSNPHLKAVFELWKKSHKKDR